MFIGTGLRISRAWNQTGNKWLELPDIAKFLLNPQNVSMLHYTIVIALAWPLFMTAASRLLSAKVYRSKHSHAILTRLFRRS